jgi:molybdenum transport protein
LFVYDFLVERLLAEDVPYGDVTTEAMGLEDVPGVMEFGTRFDCVVAGVAEAEAVLKKLGAEVEVFHKSGSLLSAKTPVMTAKATAGILHAGWKVAQNVMEHATGIATRTHAMVVKGRKVNPNLVVACTRKSFPGGKTICMNAVEAGGGVPHRLGVSETFLLFDNHASFFKDDEAMYAALKKAALRLPEKKLAVEVDSLEKALKAAEAGAGIVQFDKVKPDKLTLWVSKIRKAYPHVIIDAAGGINTETVAEYAETGIDVAVTSFVYTGKPVDIEVTIRPD